MGKWFTTGEAGRALGIHAKTVARMIKGKRLMGRYHSGHWRALRAHVECIRNGWMLLDKGIFWK